MVDELEFFARRGEAAARAELARRYDDLATRLALQFRGRGQSYDDLAQVARIGLLNAIDRFDVDRGVTFATFATRTIIGVLKRHLRDKAWAVRVPRALQERWLETNQAVQDLSQKLGRSPTLREIAHAVDLDVEDVIEALEAGGAFSASSVDAPPATGDEGLSLAETLGGDDPLFQHSADRVAVRELIAALPDRGRSILYKRFYEGKTQAEIAEDLDISQMHVSRLLRSTLETLREGLVGQE